MGFFLTLFLFIGALILSEVLKPKPNQENARPASLGDFKFPTATEERVVPIVWGTVKLEGPNVVWYGDLRQTAIEKKVKTGLFSSKDVTVGFRYYIGIQFALCRGPVDHISRIWIGEEEVWSGLVTDGAISINQPSLFGGDELGQGGVVGTFRFFRGTETQNPSSYLSKLQNQGGATPGNRGTAYGVFEQGYIGNSTNIKPWAFEVRRLPTFSNGLAYAPNSGADANPAAVLYEILTNDEWGLGFPAADIDESAFISVAQTLLSEGNGFSFILDRPRQIADLIEEIQRQIDGVVFLDQRTGKWTVKLARADYNVNTIPTINETNLIEVKEFTRGSWDDTTNYVTVQFTDRDRDYFGTFALAQDMANFRIQGVNNKSNIVFPGVKNKTLANNLAWRELRLLAFPVARATVTVNRQFWNAVPTDVVKWSSAALGFEDLVMRITRVDLGRLAEGKIELTLVQDVFGVGAAVFGDPPPSGWSPPSTELVAIPAAESLAFEAPRAFIERDPDALTRGLPHRVWAAARNQGDGAVEFDLRTRTGANPFETGRTVRRFMLLGELANAIGPSEGGGNGTVDNIDIVPTPDGQQLILDEFQSRSVSELGEELSQLILVDQEFMLVQNAVANASNIRLQNAYRGCLDSAQAAHGAGAKVWLLFVGGGIDSRQYSPSSTVAVRLVTRSRDDELSESAAPILQVQMNNRHLRPYPPIRFVVIGGAAWPTTAQSIDANGSGDAAGPVISFWRRDYTNPNELANHIGGDSAPSNNTTVYRARVFNADGDPDVELFVTDWNNGGNSVKVDRTKILRYTDGIIPNELRVDIETKHTVDGVDYQATQDLSWTFPIFSDLEDDFYLGQLSSNEVSNAWSAPSTGNYNFTLGTALTLGTIRARINGGAWQDIITPGNTTGTLTGVTAGDTIEVSPSNSQVDGRDETILLVNAPSVTTDAFAIIA